MSKVTEQQQMLLHIAKSKIDKNVRSTLMHHFDEIKIVSLNEINK